MGIDEDIQRIEEEIEETPYNKSTEHHIGKLKAKLAKLREEREKRRQGTAAEGGGYAVSKTGHATVGLVGFPSVGKSTLLNALTNAESEVGDYEFTTLEVVPGMMRHRSADIQVLDLPGLIHGAASNRGRGREVIAVARNSDLIILVVDPYDASQLDVIVDELHDAHIRLNDSPPNVRVTKHDRGGLDVQFTVEPTHVTEDLARDILDQWGLVNATAVVREDVTPDELVDALAGNRAYVPAIVAVNKADEADPGIVRERLADLRDRGWTAVPISAREGRNLRALQDAIVDNLDLMRVFLKPQGGEADMDEPLVVRTGASVGDVCDRIHRDMRRRFRYAQVTGPSSKFPDQRVGIDHELRDGDVLTLIVRK